MMRRWTWMGMVLLAGGLFLFQSGCAEQKSKSGGTMSIDPATAVKPGVPLINIPTTPKTAPDKTGDTDKATTPVETLAPTEDEETPSKTPVEAGSTTGGGTEVPGTPGF